MTAAGDVPTQTDTTAAAAGIPGLVIRPYRGEEDIPEMVRIQNAEWEADGTTYRSSVAEQVAWLGHPSEQFDAIRDISIAEIGGRMVAHARRDWVDASDGVREYRGGGAVDPAWRRRGIGRALAEHGERRARKMAGEQATHRPRVLGVFTEGRNAGATALAAGLGYQPVRWFFAMERPNLGRDLPELWPLPDGIEVRAVASEHLRAIWKADIEAFRDHWGGHDESEEAFLRYRDSPDFDPSLWVVAWEGEEVVAACINTIYPHENAAIGRRRGWLDSVFTRRSWRRRGIAGALIARSLHILAERGMDCAVLGVDADNPSGALHLYESFGFATTERGQAWRKPMEL